MSKELQVSASFSYATSVFASLARAVTGKDVDIAGAKLEAGVLAVTTAEVAIPTGGVTVGSSWAWFKNLDATNFIELRVATGGTKFAKLLPGEFAFLRLGSGVTAPYCLADTATCNMEYALLSV